jgi:hypothetical protein
MNAYIVECRVADSRRCAERKSVMKIFEWSFAGLLAAVALSSGCDVDEVQDGVAERDGVADEADHEELVAAVEPVGASNGWTRYT